MCYSWEQPQRQQLWQVVRLQAKWVAQTLFRILTTSSSFDHIQDLLKAFLPEDVSEQDLASQVLSKSVASTLVSFHRLIYGQHLEETLDTISTTVASTDMVSFYKPIQRVPNLTQFKKMIHAMRQLVSQQQLDKQMSEQVSLAKEDFQAAQQATREKEREVKEGTITFHSLRIYLDLIVTFKLKLSQLPQSESSKYYAFVQEANKFIEQDSLTCCCK